jgi:undecaprenyl-phosphate 4-deoxy-4-formamido-L-arabinose transferase
MTSSAPNLSIVIPVFNEEGNLGELYERLSKTLASTKRTYEIILVDDGSSDSSSKILTQLAEKDPCVRAVILTRNFGQHGAVMAGFKESRGEIIVTLDADLQNPPEEIPKLIAKMDEGYDLVGGLRQSRKDSFLRKIPSFLTNRMASVVVGKKLRDCGCMLRAYRRDVIDELLEFRDSSIFIPALTASIASRYVEIPVAHDERRHGASKYHIFRLMLIYFDLITGYSAVPIQMVTLAGIGISAAGFLFGAFLLIRRLMMGPDPSQGVFTLMAILFIFMGFLFLVLGLIGEYISRIYLEVRNRPKFRIRKIHSKTQ